MEAASSARSIRREVETTTLPWKEHADEGNPIVVQVASLIEDLEASLRVGELKPPMVKDDEK